MIDSNQDLIRLNALFITFGYSKNEKNLSEMILFNEIKY